MSQGNDSGYDREEARRRARERLEARQRGGASAGVSGGRGRAGNASASRRAAGRDGGGRSASVRGASNARPGRSSQVPVEEERLESSRAAGPSRRSRGEYADGAGNSRRRPVSNEPQNPVLDVLTAIASAIVGIFGALGQAIGGLVENFRGGNDRGPYSNGPQFHKQGGSGLKIAVIAVGVVVVAVVLLSGLRACGDACADFSVQMGASHAISNAKGKVEAYKDTAHQQLVKSISKKKLRKYLDADTVNELVKLAKENVDVAWICVNCEDKKYAEDGSAVQAKLLKLALDPLAVDFVRNYPAKYPAKKASGKCEAFDQGTVPHLYQWDTRWGFTEYSSTTFALTGCCPTSMAMVYQGLTGKYDRSPYDMAKLAKKKGYMTPYNGTTGGFFTGVDGILGLNAFSMNKTKKAIKEVLSNGGLIIANVGPGDFTSGGHYIVVTEYKDGKLTINDPYSSIRSGKKWDVTRVLNQTTALYGFYKV